MKKIKSQEKDIAKYNTQDKPNWCPGCGNFGIWVSLKNAITELEIPAYNVVLVGDIGCSGKMPYWLPYNHFNGLHGRSIPIAEGVKLANHKLHVIVIGGDGGLLSEGLQHFIHGAKRDIDITVLLHNNQLYGLTKGQNSSTSDKNYRSGTSIAEIVETPLNPSMLAISANATFVASGFAGNTKHLTQMIKQAILHRGFSFVNAYQPCVTYNYINTYSFYSTKSYNLEDIGYNPQDKTQALIKSMEIDDGDKFPLGVLYQNTNSKSFDERFFKNNDPLINKDLQKVDISASFAIKVKSK